MNFKLLNPAVLIIAFGFLSNLTFAQKLVKTYHDKYSQTKIFEKYYVNSNGVPNGTYENFFETGAKRESGSYLNGKKNGKWTQYFEVAEANGQFGEAMCNGQILGIENYKNGLKHGEFKNWTCQTDNRAKLLKSVDKYENDEKTYSCSYYSSGKKQLESFEKNGTETRWFENGQVFYSVSIVDGKKKGKEIWYYENGKVLQEKEYDGSYHLINQWVRYNENGQIIFKVDFTDKNTEYIQFVENLNAKSPIVSNWGYGKVIEYFPESGKKSTEYYGYLQTKQKSFYQVVSQGSDIADQFDPSNIGDFIEFYEHGKTKRKVKYVNQNSIPIKQEDVTYFESGEVEERNTFDEKGNITSIEVYYPNGKLYTCLKDNLIFMFSPTTDTIVKAPFYEFSREDILNEGKLFNPSSDKVYRSLFVFNEQNKKPSGFLTLYNEFYTPFDSLSEKGYDGYVKIDFPNRKAEFFNFNDENLGEAKFNYGNHSASSTGYGFLGLYTLVYNGEKSTYEIKQSGYEPQKYSGEDLKRIECDNNQKAIIENNQTIIDFYATPSNNAYTTKVTYKKKQIYVAYNNYYNSIATKLQNQKCAEIEEEVERLKDLSEKLLKIKELDTKDLESSLKKEKDLNKRIDLIFNY